MYLLHQLKVFGVNLPLRLQSLIALVTDPDKAACEHMQHVKMVAAQGRLHASDNQLASFVACPGHAHAAPAARGTPRTTVDHRTTDSAVARGAEVSYPAREDLLSSTRRFSLFLKILPPWCMSSCATSPWSPRTASCLWDVYSEFRVRVST